MLLIINIIKEKGLFLLYINNIYFPIALFSSNSIPIYPLYKFILYLCSSLIFFYYFYYLYT